MKVVMLRRDYFANNTEGESEFNYLLYQLGIPEKDYDKYEEVELKVSSFEIE